MAKKKMPVTATKAATATLPIISTKPEKVLSKAQTQFNRLVIQIDQLKTQISGLEAEFSTLRVRLSKEVLPLMSDYQKKRKDFVLKLDEVYDGGALKKGELKSLSRHIAELSFQLYQELEEEDEVLKGLHEKHADVSIEESQSMASEAYQEVFKDIFGIDLDIKEMEDNPAEYWEKKQEEWSADRAKRKKTAKQLQKEEQLAAEEKLLVKDARTVYTTLVKEIHPDKEQDEDARLWKTQLMQKVTQAYQSKDLYELLKLQIEYKLTSDEWLDDALEDQLERYNTLLQRQVAELRNEKQNLTHGPNARLYFDFFGSNDKVSAAKFNRQVATLRHSVKMLDEQMRIAADPAILREYLKEVKRMHKKQDSFDNLLGFGF